MQTRLNILINTNKYAILQNISCFEPRWNVNLVDYISRLEKRQKKNRNTENFWPNQAKRIDKQAGLNNPHGIGPQADRPSTQGTPKETHINIKLIWSLVSKADHNDNKKEINTLLIRNW